MSGRGTVYEDQEYYRREERAPPRAAVRVRDFDDDINYREPGSRPSFLETDDYRVTSGALALRGRDAGPLERRPRAASEVRIRERDERIVERPAQDRVRIREMAVERREPSPPQERLRARVTETTQRYRERSPSPVRVVRETFRERELPRPRSLSPPNIERLRIRTNEREQVRAPSPSPSPSPPPAPPAIQAPPIHQEIITHHRHIDHGFERARVPTPPPPPRREPPRVKETDIDIYTSRNNTEVDITRKSSRSHTPVAPPRRPSLFHDDSYIYEQERDKLRVRDTRMDISRRRSLSARPDKVRLDIRDDDEADYYARKVDERAYMGEAWNGATKDWAIVDVPPGTERVRMDGVGGGSQEITWQRYNGVRRSKFIPERAPEREIARERVEIREEPRRETRETTGLEIDISMNRGSKRESNGGLYEREYERIEETSGRAVGFPRAPPKQRVGDLWTEITKDLVSREAIEEMGYDYEETEFFFYVLQYLKYDDVVALVDLSEVIRRERQDRLRDIERERLRMERREREREERDRRERRWERDSGFSDERIIEREVVYDSTGRRARRSGAW